MTEQFNFNISLSVLNHLGRNLYRNFITVLGEAISNSWDAEATKVEIGIDREKGCFWIKDNGDGMDADDFQEKFLTIGYSKRDESGGFSPYKKRPYIGRKGIGKLALLSCADRIHITSTINGKDYTGGIIDNRMLDKAITDNSKPEDYPLEDLEDGTFDFLKIGHDQGTIIYFQNLNDGIENQIKTLRKLIALHFRFSLVTDTLKDDSFSIIVNDKEIDFDDIKDLSESTEFLWNINETNDPFLETLTNKKEPAKDLSVNNKNIKGFIASVEKPSQLNILGAGEKVGIDVFVNGRLRETNILKHTPAFATRHIASYLYGQIHLDILDDGNSDKPDKFTTSREGIKPDDILYAEILNTIENEIFNLLSKQWDEWRRKHKQDGDPDGEGIEKYQRWLEQSKNAREKYFNAKINSLKNLDNATKTILKKKLGKLSYNNMEVYQDLFILENIFRIFLEERQICDVDNFPKNNETEFELNHHEFNRVKTDRVKQKEEYFPNNPIVTKENDLNYLSLKSLCILTYVINTATAKADSSSTMKDDITEITPVRNAVMHTNEVSEEIMKWYKIKNTIIECLDSLNIKP